MNDAMNNWSAQVIAMLAISAAVIAVFWVAQGVEEAIYASAVLLVFTALVHFGRRYSGTLEVMSGTGDERVRSLYTRAVAIAGSVMALLLPGWFLVTVAQGDPNTTLSTLSVIFGATFVGAVVLLARRC
jgi:hypothetical protein